jgi:hypothetical protein
LIPRAPNLGLGRIGRRHCASLSHCAIGFGWHTSPLDEYPHLLNTLHDITGRGAGFKSLADTWADTTTPHGRLMLAVLGGLAEFEKRTDQGQD